MPQPTDEHLEMSILLDQRLLKVLREGQVVMDKEGQPVTVTPSASILSLVHKRLADRGYERPPGNSEGAADIRKNFSEALKELDEHQKGFEEQVHELDDDEI